jgi:hypothetical protein
MFDVTKREQIEADVCNRLAAGETLSSICKTPGYPDTRTIWQWRAENPSFFSAVARAREHGFDCIAEDCVEIADTGDMTDTQRAKLRVDTRLKLLSKWDAKRYGDKLQLDADVRMEVTLVDASSTVATIVHPPQLPKPDDGD